MINNNLLHLFKDYINYPSHIGTATQETFVDNAGNNIDVGVRMPTANEASDYALKCRSITSDFVSIKIFTTPINDLSTNTYYVSGSTDLNISYILKGIGSTMNGGKLEFNYNFDVTYNGSNEDGVTIKSFIMDKETWNFTYDSSYGDWSPHKNTYNMIISACNLNEPLTIGIGETYNISVKEIINANE